MGYYIMGNTKDQNVWFHLSACLMFLHSSSAYFQNLLLAIIPQFTGKPPTTSHFKLKRNYMFSHFDMYRDAITDWFRIDNFHDFSIKEKNIDSLSAHHSSFEHM
jgi:hypothetical protein